MTVQTAPRDLSERVAHTRQPTGQDAGPSSPEPSASDPPATIPPGGEERSVVGAIWPLMVTVFVGNLPYPASSIFVGSLATDFGVESATIGGLRAVSGAAALTIGFLAAPLLDRVPRAVTVLLGLGLVMVGSLLPLLGEMVTLTASFFTVGAAMAILVPAVQAAGGDLFQGPSAGRAASLVNASQSLSGSLAGPIMVVPALLGGWHAGYASIAVLALLTCLLAAWRLSWRPPTGVARVGYRAAFGLVARAPGALPLLAASALRNCAFFGFVVYLAAFFADRFQAGTPLLGLVWFIGAFGFFIANVLAGRLVNGGQDGIAVRWWRDPVTLLLLSTVASVVLAPLTFVAPSVPLAIIATTVYAVIQGVLVAALVSLLVRRYMSLRGPVMALNGVGQNVGTVVGTAVAGLGLAVAGYDGLAVTLVLMTGAAAVTLLTALPALREPPAVSLEPSPAPSPA
jgi:MFS transporter, DHA1 family, inner membrane transport protein